MSPSDLVLTVLGSLGGGAALVAGAKAFAAWLASRAARAVEVSDAHAARDSERAEAYVREIEGQRDSWREACDRLRDERDAERDRTRQLTELLHEARLEIARTVQRLEDPHASAPPASASSDS